MPEHVPLEIPEAPQLAQNIVHFARALRRAGLPVGPGRVVDAIHAVSAAGFTEKRDFYWVLHACFVSKPEHRVIFAQVFRLFWRDPRFLEHMMGMLFPSIRGVSEEHVVKPGEKRAAEALLPELPDMPEDFEAPEQTGEELEIDATLTMSSEERLRTQDFEQMTLAEQQEAKKLLARLRLPVKPLTSRRLCAASYGRRVDRARTLRGAMRSGGEVRGIARADQRIRWPNLVVLCDVSGSMSQYSRMILHFVHAVAQAKGAGWAKVHAFTIGTRLTNITRLMRTRDVDAALKAAGQEVQDWEGGTRLGACLHAFNRDWSRRVMGQGAVVLMITDGLDRAQGPDLERAIERLHLSARQLIWLNPLLRWDGFAPKAGGIRTMLPHVDTFCAGHSVAALEDLAVVLSRAGDGGEKRRLMVML